VQELRKVPRQEMEQELRKDLRLQELRPAVQSRQLLLQVPRRDRRQEPEQDFRKVPRLQEPGLRTYFEQRPAGQSRQ